MWLNMKHKVLGSNKLGKQVATIIPPVYQNLFFLLSLLQPFDKRLQSFHERLPAIMLQSLGTDRNTMPLLNCYISFMGRSFCVVTCPSGLNLYGTKGGQYLQLGHLGHTVFL
jgi:hypothetical protein